MEVPEPQHQLKVPVIRRQVYTVCFEQATADHTFIHCDVHTRWTKEAREQASADMRTLLALHGGPLYAVHDPADRKHHKFLSLFGFKLIAEYVDDLDRRRELYRAT